MAKADKKAPEAAPEASGQGRTVTLPNGVKRIEYIRDQFYKEGVSRSDIKKAINEMVDEEDQIPYQIVFAATKTNEDPRIASAARKTAAAEAKAKKEADAAEEAAKAEKAKK